MMKNIKAYECNGSISLDKHYLENLADGKSEVKEGYFTLCLSDIERLKEANDNLFSFSLYNGYLENGEEEAAALYFENHARCISNYNKQAALNLANEGEKI